MSPFRRGKYWSLYVPRRSGGAVQRACGTTDGKLAIKMGRMIDTLADQRRWDILEAIDAELFTVAQTYDAYVTNALGDLLTNAKHPLIDTMIGPWLASLHVAERTLIVYRQRIKKLIPIAMKASDFTAGWVTDTVSALDISSGSKREYQMVLRLFANYLVSHRILLSNPILEPGLVRRHKRNRPRGIWMPEKIDIALVRATSDPIARAYFALVHATGAERDAARSMRRRDLNLDDGTCHIPGTKNRYRDRAGVPIEPWAWPFLAAHCAGLLPDAPLFPILNRKTIQAAHVGARTAINAPEYQLRDARHSFAVRAILRGVPLWQVSQWLGHNDIATTARIYAQFGLQAALAELTNQSSSLKATR